MAQNRIDARFRQLAAGRHAGLIPYLTGGYPDLDITTRLIERFDQAGAAAIEMGFPFSDSIADGPVIQDSFHRVLAGGQRLDDLFLAVSRARRTVEVPLIAMVSYTIVQRAGLGPFVDRAAKVGFDGLITPDLPFEEARRLFETTQAAGLKNIMLVAANTPDQRARRILELCTGFVYQVAVAGTTGERSRVADDLAGNVGRLRGATDLPICVGFGIGTPDQAEQAGQLADGVIVGSAIVRRITQAVEGGRSRDHLVENVAAFVGELIAAAGDRSQ